MSCVETPEVLAARALTACLYPWRKTERKMPLSAMKEAFFNGANVDGMRENPGRSMMLQVRSCGEACTMFETKKSDGFAQVKQASYHINYDPSIIIEDTGGTYVSQETWNYLQKHY